MTTGSIVDKVQLYLSKTEDVRFGNVNFLELLSEALADDNASYAYGKDRLHRMIGEYHEANNDIEKTIENWEKAIEINPKIGIKKRLDSLKKKSGKYL